MSTTVNPTTTKLSDTQLVILTTAVQRADRAVIMPDRLTGGAAAKVVNALAGKGLVEAVTATPGMPVWRKSGDGRHVALIITDAGLEALGLEPQPTLAAEPSEPAAPEAASPEPTEPRRRQPRTGTKQEMLIDMLKRPEGATAPEVVAATGWLPHTVRGAIAGALKKKLGLQITSEKVEDRGRVYRIQA